MRAKKFMIGKEEVGHLGWLARLELSEAEKELFERKLSSILDYFAVLDSEAAGEAAGATAGATAGEATSVELTYHGLKNVVRADEPRAALSQAEALRNAPKTEKGYFKSPRIL